MQQLTAAILAFAIGLFIVNNVVFLHSHKLPDGSIVVHAHPYNKSQEKAPFKTHKHTSAELFHIAHVQLLFISTVFSLFAASFIVQKHCFFYRTSFKLCSDVFKLNGRDPPFHCAAIG